MTDGRLARRKMLRVLRRGGFKSRAFYLLRLPLPDGVITYAFGVTHNRIGRSIIIHATVGIFR